MRRIVVLWCAVAAFVPAFSNGASAEQASHLGRTITDVRVEIAGIAATQPNVVGLIETRIGDVLGMQAVRNTIDHLIGLGRFEDVRVFAAATDQGVSLTWHLTPVRRIAKISIAGSSIRMSGVGTPTMTTCPARSRA